MHQGADLLALGGPHLGQEELAALYHRGADLVLVLVLRLDVLKVLDEGLAAVQ